MPKVTCAWINCKYNSFKLPKQVEIEIQKGHIPFISGSGECLYDKTINFSVEESETEEMLVCDNYEDGEKLLFNN